ncbi:flagellar biosynthesis anti-sigma factor FlgM [Betaproteobacteria bacterium]|nr:flagellar biosynthesis anti-sigma factor FlgM [Betaproteobacteria bacterium]
MSEPVNSLIKTVQPDRPTGPNPKKPADENDKQIRDIEKDEVFLSDIAKKTLETESAFDAKKVESIKQAIEDGNYPLDSRKIAESFIAMESLIGNAKRR